MAKNDLETLADVKAAIPLSATLGGTQMGAYNTAYAQTLTDTYGNNKYITVDNFEHLMDVDKLYIQVGTNGNLLNSIIPYSSITTEAFDEMGADGVLNYSGDIKEVDIELGNSGRIFCDSNDVLMHFADTAATAAYPANMTLKQAITDQSTYTSQYLKGNTNVRTMHELKYFIWPNEDPSNSQAPAKYFDTCSNLTEVTLPKTLKRIANSMFSHCTSLHAPDMMRCTGLTRIEGSAFAGCPQITRYEFPASLNYIGSSAFLYNNGTNVRHDFIFHSTVPPTLYNYQVFDCYYSGAYRRNMVYIFVPYSSDGSVLAAYKAATNWSTLSSNIRQLNADGTLPV